MADPKNPEEKRPSEEREQTTHHETSSVDWGNVVQEMCQFAREPYQPQAELLQLRQRIDTEVERSHRRIVERIAREAGVDLQPIFDEARRRNAVKRRNVTKVLKRLEAKAAESATEQKKRYHWLREQYLRDFPQHHGPEQQGEPELKFNRPFAWSGSATPSFCNTVFGSMCSEPNFGTDEASADISASTERVGVWLYPRIYTDSGDCDNRGWATTLQNVTYRLGPPSSSFAVTSTRIDLIGTGVATAHLGDTGWFTSPNPAFQHSFVELSVSIAQVVRGELHGPWPLISSQLFVGNGEYVRSIRLLLSGDIYPANIILRNPNVGGGDVTCHLQVACRAITLGSNGRVRLEFRAPDHGIFLGGVSLMGDYV